MQEFIGLAYFAEIPAVIFDVQRGSPSTGMPTRTQQADILCCAHASHGDTKHVLLFPEDPHEAFAFAAEAFDLADRLQTPVFVMLDLDIGMNDWLVEPLAWDEERQFDRGKVMTAAELEAGVEFGRYLDVDGDGIPYRTLPGAHPTRGAFFTRGTTKDRYARYSEEGPDYVDNMQRLLHKFETAKRLVPAPVKRTAARGHPLWRDLFRLDLAGHGRSARSARAARHPPRHDAGARLSVPRGCVRFRRRARPRLPRRAEPRRAIAHLLIIDGEIDPARLVPILHYDGTPITARFIVKAIADMLEIVTLAPLRKALP